MLKIVIPVDLPQMKRVVITERDYSADAWQKHELRYGRVVLVLAVELDAGTAEDFDGACRRADAKEAEAWIPGEGCRFVGEAMLQRLEIQITDKIINPRISQ